MQRDRRAYLWDIRNSLQLILRFVENRTLDDYRQDPMLRAAVERQFEIIGEALSQLLRRFPETAVHITQHSEIIAFRNMLVHGYHLVDDSIVWSVIHNDLLVLNHEIESLVAGSDPSA